MPERTVINYYCRSSIESFQVLNDSRLSKINSLDSVPSKYKKNHFLNYDGSYFWLIHQGIIKVSVICEDGHVCTTGYWGKQDIVYYSPPPKSYVELNCVTDVFLQRIPMEEAHAVTPALLFCLSDTQRLLEIQSLKYVWQKVQSTFLWLASKFGHTTWEGCFIDCPLTHDDLSDLIGSTRVTVSRYCSRLIQLGLLKRHKRYYILTPKALENKNWIKVD